MPNDNKNNTDTAIQSNGQVDNSQTQPESGTPAMENPTPDATKAVQPEQSPATPVSNPDIQEDPTANGSAPVTQPNPSNNEPVQSEIPQQTPTSTNPESNSAPLAANDQPIGTSSIIGGVDENLPENQNTEVAAGQPSYNEIVKPKRNIALIGIIVGILLLLIGGGAYYYFFIHEQDATDTEDILESVEERDDSMPVVSPDENFEEDEGISGSGEFEASDIQNDSFINQLDQLETNSTNDMEQELESVDYSGIDTEIQNESF